MKATDNIQLLAAFHNAGADADSKSEDLYSFFHCQSNWSDAVIHAMKNYDTTSNSTAFRNTGAEADVDP